MSKRQQQPTSSHQSSGTEQAQGPVTEDAGLAHAEQVGNGAVQDEMRGQEEGQEEVGDRESMPIEAWGVAQLDSVDVILRFVDAVGADKALRMVLELGTDLLLDLLEAIAANPTYVDLFFNVAASVGQLTFLPTLPPTVTASLMSEALRRGADWLLDQMATWSPEPLLVIAKHVEQTELRDILASGSNLAQAFLAAWWTPGVGLTLTADLEAAVNSVIVGAGYTGTIRHLGEGEFELTVEVRGKVGGEVGEGGSAGGGTAKAMFVIEGEGSVQGKSTNMLASLYAGAVLGAAGFMKDGPVGNMVAAAMTTLIPWADVLDSFEVEGAVRIGGEAKAKGSELMKGVLAATVGAGAKATFENLEGEGRDFERGDITIEVGAAAAGELTIPGGKIGDTIKLLFPEPGDVAVGGAVAAHFDFDMAREQVFGTPTFEVIANGKGLGCETSVGVEAAVPESADLDALIDSLQALHFNSKVSLEHPLAKKVVPADYLPEFLEAHGVLVQSGSLEIDATISRETTQELAEYVVGALTSVTDPAKLSQALVDWTRDPLGMSQGVVLTLLCQAVAGCSSLTATVSAGYTFKTEQAAEVAAGTKWGAAAEVGGTLDVERDVMGEGATVTIDTIRQLVRTAGGDTEAQAAK